MTWIYIISVYLICLIISVAWVKSAPMAYEDKSGFHYGKEPDQPNGEDNHIIDQPVSQYIKENYNLDSRPVIPVKSKFIKLDKRG